MAPPRRVRFAPSKAAIGRDLDIARARKEFFPNRPDVSDDRALRRQQQADQLAAFKGQFTKPVEGATGLVQMTQDAPRTLAQEEMRLANVLGPTPREIGSDFMRGLGSFTSDLSNRIQSGSIGILGVAKDLYNQFTNNATKAKNALVQGFNNLTDVEQEILKNPNKYSRMSTHPRVQGIKDIEAFQMTELDKANLIKENMDRVTTVVDQDDSFRRTPATGITTSPTVFDDSFRRAPATGITAPTVFDNKFLRMPGRGYQAGAGIPAISQPQFEIVTDYVSPEDRMQNLINQNIQNNNAMFNDGVMTPSDTEDIFGINLQ